MRIQHSGIWGLLVSEKVSEMTVREFLEKATKKGANETLEDPNLGLLRVLLNEGFTEEQANNLKMKKAWNLYLDSLTNVISQTFTGIYKGLEQSPERASIIEPHLKNITKQLEGFIRELEKEEDNEETRS